MYLAGAVGCSAAHLTFAGKNGPPALGASGSVLSIVTVFGLTYPWQPITLLLFFIPVTMPAIALVGKKQRKRIKKRKKQRYRKKQRFRKSEK